MIIGMIKRIRQRIGCRGKRPSIRQPACLTSIRSKQMVRLLMASQVTRATTSVEK